MMPLKIRFRFLFLMTAWLVVAGCTDMSWLEAALNPPKEQKEQKPEALLAAEGSWNLVESQQGYDPLQQHMSARGQVNPDQIRGRRAYTTTAKAPHEEVHHRVIRLERDLNTLRHDFNRLLPPLSSLIVSDRHLDATIENIRMKYMDSLKKDVSMVAPSNGAAGAAAAIPAKSKMKPAAVYNRKPKKIHKSKRAHKVITGGPSRVTSMRTGTHPGKTRIVLDVTTPAQFSYDLDNNEKILLVDLPNTAWTAARNRNFAKHPLLKAYSIHPSGNNGSTLVLELKKPSSVTMSTALKPNHIYGNRIVLDLAS